MAENPKIEDMDSHNLSSSSKEFELDKLGTQKISVSEQPNRLQSTNFESDSFIVDVDRLSLLTDKDITSNSRLTKSLSRKVSQQKGSEKKIINPSVGNEKDNSGLVATSSPRAALGGHSWPEKPMVVTVGTKDHPTSPHVHHQITIMTGNIGPTTAGESRWGGKRLGFRRSSSWAIDPRKILLFFATLSSMGTMLLIYFTLSMAKHGVDESGLNQ